MDNKEYIRNAFTDEELARGCFNNKDGLSPIWTKHFIHKISEHIDFNDVKVVLDVGSRDGCQSLEFNRWFPNAKIFAFEPVPFNIEWCVKNTKNIENIEVIPKAVNSFNGKTKFYEVVNGNVGASSLFKKTNHSWSNVWNQKEIEVECIRLSDWLFENNIEKVDIMWVDVQGAEKQVYESMGDYLMNVSAIATEIALQELYQNATKKEELELILKDNFTIIEKVVAPHNAEADVIYVNKKYF